MLGDRNGLWRSQKKKKKTEPTLAQTEWQFQEPTFREDALNFKTKEQNPLEKRQYRLNYDNFNRSFVGVISSEDDRPAKTSRIFLSRASVRERDNFFS
jgi:hypothetical protein